MMTWGNGLICSGDFLNFSFRIDFCDGGCSPCGLAMLRSLFRSASIFLALRARNAAFLQNKFFVPYPIFLALRARNIGCVSEKQRAPLFFILLRSRRIDSKLSSAALL